MEPTPAPRMAVGGAVSTARSHTRARNKERRRGYPLQPRFKPAAELDPSSKGYTSRLAIQLVRAGLASPDILTVGERRAATGIRPDDTPTTEQEETP